MTMPTAQPADQHNIAGTILVTPGMGKVEAEEKRIERAAARLASRGFNIIGHMSYAIEFKAPTETFQTTLGIKPPAADNSYSATVYPQDRKLKGLINYVILKPPAQTAALA